MQRRVASGDSIFTCRGLKIRIAAIAWDSSLNSTSGAYMTKLRSTHAWMLTGVASAVVGLTFMAGSALAQTVDAAVVVQDPGVRGGPAGAGGPLPGLTTTNPNGTPGGQ